MPTDPYHIQNIDHIFEAKRLGQAAQYCIDNPSDGSEDKDIMVAIHLGILHALIYISEAINEAS